MNAREADDALFIRSYVVTAAAASEERRRGRDSVVVGKRLLTVVA